MTKIKKMHFNPMECSRNFLHLLAHTLDHMDTMVGILDLKGKVLYANRAALKKINTSYDKIIGIDFLDSPWRTHSKETIYLTKDMMTKAFAGESSVIEDFIINRDGKWVPMLFSISPVRDVNGKIIAIVPEGKSITEQKRLQAEIRKEQWETQQWIDSMGAYVAKCDKEGRVISCNQPFLNAMRITHCEIAEQYICDTVWLGHSSKTQKKLQRAVKDAGAGKKVGIEVVLALGKNEPKLFLFSVSPILNSAGKVAFLAMEIIDIADQVRLRERMIAHEKEYSNRLEREVSQIAMVLRETELFNQNLINAASVGIIYLDENDRVMFVNPDMKIKLGKTVASIKGKRLSGFGIYMTDRSWKKIDGREKEKIYFGKMKMILQINGKDDLLFDVNAAALKGSLGGTRGTVLIMDDVTERNRLEEETLRVRIQSEKMSSLKLFISGIAHELNNPLTSIIGCAEHLEEDSELVEESAEAAKIIVDDARRAGKIVENLSEFAGRDAFTGTLIDLNEVIRNLVDIRINEVKKRNIELILDLDSSIKSIVAGVIEIQQVLLNLVRNAVNIIEESGKGDLIIIRTFTDKGSAVLLVEDNGPGIPSDRITKIFDPFFTTRHGQKGAGLGLSIVHGMIQKMGGVISVDTTHGAGAKFEIRFPLPRSSFHSHADKSKDLCTIPFSILVVDDDPHICTDISNHMSSMSCDIDAVYSGYGALKKIKVKQYDLLLTEIKMPEMNGFELYQAVRSLRPEYLNRFAFMTSFLEQEKREIIGALGIEILQKPFSKTDIIRLLQRSDISSFR